MTEHDLINKDLKLADMERITKTDDHIKRMERSADENKLLAAVIKSLPKLSGYRLAKVRAAIGNEIQRRNG